MTQGLAHRHDLTQAGDLRVALGIDHASQLGAEIIDSGDTNPGRDLRVRVRVKARVRIRVRIRVRVMAIEYLFWHDQGQFELALG